jgi:hypothetical protein
MSRFLLYGVLLELWLYVLHSTFSCLNNMNALKLVHVSIDINLVLGWCCHGLSGLLVHCLGCH